MFICVSFPLYDLNETRIHVYVNRRQLCRAYTFLVRNTIGEREFWIFSHTWQEYVKNGFLKKLGCVDVSWIYAAKGRVSGFAVEDSHKFCDCKNFFFFFFFTSCGTDRISRMLCCVGLVGSGKINKTGFRSLSRYKRSILLPPLWTFGPIPGHGLPLHGLAIMLIGHATGNRTPLDEWSAGHRDLYLKTHNTHNRQISMPLTIFEPTIPESEWPQTCFGLYCVY